MFHLIHDPNAIYQHIKNHAERGEVYALAEDLADIVAQTSDLITRTAHDPYIGRETRDAAQQLIGDRMDQKDIPRLNGSVRDEITKPGHGPTYKLDVALRAVTEVLPGLVEKTKTVAATQERPRPDFGDGSNAPASVAVLMMQLLRLSKKFPACRAMLNDQNIENVTVVCLRDERWCSTGVELLQSYDETVEASKLNKTRIFNALIPSQLTLIAIAPYIGGVITVGNIFRSEIPENLVNAIKAQIERPLESTGPHALARFLNDSVDALFGAVSGHTQLAPIVDKAIAKHPDLEMYRRRAKRQAPPTAAAG